MSDKLYSGGALFKVDSNHPKAPVQQGDIVIQRDLLKQLVDEAKAGREAKLRVTCWRREGRKGPFLSVDIKEYGEWEREAQAKRSGQQAQAPQVQADDPFGSGDDGW
jgi:hypothetical protein